MDFNLSLIGGRLTATPEYKLNENGIAITKIQIAVNRYYKAGEQKENKKETEFIRVVFFGKMADNVRTFFNKGDSIFVSGRIHTQTWTDQSNVKRYMTEIVADSWQFAGEKKQEVSAEQVDKALEKVDIPF